MVTKHVLIKSTISLSLAAALSACGGGGGGGSDTPDSLTCTAPQVLNNTGTACIDPPATNTAPSITSDATIAVTEGITNGASVYQAAATDAENDTLSWSLTDDAGMFAINAQTGELTIADSSKVVAGTYQITISVSDGSLSDDSTIDVTVSGGSSVVTPEKVPTSSQAVIYYKRADDDYTGWTLHAWNNESCDGYALFSSPGTGSNEGTEWDAGLTPNDVDDNYGTYWVIDTKDGATCLNYIIHKGNDKDPNGNDQKLQLADSRWNFVISSGGIFTEPEDISVDTSLIIEGASAHWIDANTLMFNGTSNDLKLVSQLDGQLDEDFSDDNAIALVETTLTDAQKARVPHLLEDWTAYEFDATVAKQKELLKQQLVVASYQGDQAIAATYVQSAKALDALFTFGDDDADEVTDLGISYDGDVITAKVWAPTAQDMNLRVYDAAKSLVATHAMSYDDNSGVWSFTTDNTMDYDRHYYRYQVKVYHPVTQRVETTEATDPYAVNTSTNGRFAQFVNMTDDDLKPSGWDSRSIPTVTNVEDAVLLEAHIRDVSASDPTTSEANRGKYLAFTETNSDAVQYLQRLANAGVTHFHMLPANDIASIKEADTFNLDNTVDEACAIASNLSICGSETGTDTIRSVLEGLDKSNTDVAKLVDEIRGYDSFNWGYDPHHFNVVEGSYASDPEGVTRIVEFRQMVQALQGLGMRVVLDVVYNHTSSSGLYDNSVFDKLVPGYYHRYKEVSGEIERSTCCENTATEHRMMGKFVVDSLVHWAEHYGMDGFRFDVMGHMPKDVILDGRDAVAAIDADTYFYGEGWNWGEVANNRLFEQATQYNLADSKVGTFNDRPRDAIRAAALSRANVDLKDVDHIRLGLAGTLQNFVMEDQNGSKEMGKEFGQSSYALTPADIINYVSKHDNETLWDALQFGVESGTSSAQRVRIHNLSAAIPLMSQGIPFFQLGVDKMRSKSMHRNTYDFTDWYNFVDYTNSSNNWNVGLPSPGEYGYNSNGDQVDSGHGEGWKWPRIAELILDTDIPVTASDIDFSEAVFEEFLQIRSGSPLFRLTSEQAVIQRVGFHNTGKGQTPGLIVMSIDDGTGLTDLDNNVDAIVVVVNGTDSEQSHTIKTAADFELHTTQVNGVDTQVQMSSFANGTGEGTFTVAAHSIAVFIKPQGASQGAGLSTDPERVDSPYGDAQLLLTGLGTSDVALDYDDRGMYSTLVNITAGDQTFDLMDDTGTVVDFAFSDVNVHADSIAVTDSGNDAFDFTASASGTYQVSLDVSAATPELKLTLVSASVACPAPVSAGASPFAIHGGSDLYIRGDHSGWNAQEDYRFTYVGSDQYKAVADFSGSFQFKLASDDGSWTTQLWVQNSSGDIETSDLSLGTSYDVAYDNAGTDNNRMTLAEGTYSFTLTLNEANPAQGTKPAGTLIVEQCTD